MRARLHEVACGLRRNKVDIAATRDGDWWWFDHPIPLTNARGDTTTLARTHDVHIIHETDGGPAHAGAPPIGGTPRLTLSKR